MDEYEVMAAIKKSRNRQETMLALLDYEYMRDVKGAARTLRKLAHRMLERYNEIHDDGLVNEYIREAIWEHYKRERAKLVNHYRLRMGTIRRELERHRFREMTMTGIPFEVTDHSVELVRHYLGES